MKNIKKQIGNYLLPLLVIVSVLWSLVFDPIYTDKWSGAHKMIGFFEAFQWTNLFLAILLICLNFVKWDYKLIIRSGILVQFLYTYLLLMVSYSLSWQMLIFIAILSFSSSKLIYDLFELSKKKYNSPRIWVRVVIGLFLFGFAHMFAILFAEDLFARIKGINGIETIDFIEFTVPLLFVYTLDLAFIIPATIIGGIRLMRNKLIGKILGSIMLVRSIALAVALGFRHFNNIFNGDFTHILETLFWILIVFAGIFLSAKLLPKLIVSDE